MPEDEKKPIIEWVAYKTIKYSEFLRVHAAIHLFIGVCAGLLMGWAIWGR